jgi:hypothetical protein
MGASLTEIGGFIMTHKSSAKISLHDHDDKQMNVNVKKKVTVKSQLAKFYQ